MEMTDPTVRANGGEVEVWTTPQFGDDAADYKLIIEVNRVLWRHYPHWAWYVEIPPGQGVVVVRNLDLDWQGRWGWVMHKDRLLADPGLRTVMRAGGELLERYSKQRRGMKPEDIAGMQNRFAVAQK